MGYIREWDATLVDTVKNHPNLYKKELENFKDRTLRDKAWSEIASTTKSSVEECRRRWIRLRERFLRIRKHRLSKTRRGSNWTNPGGFPLYEKMLFLADQVQTRRKTISLPAISSNGLSNDSGRLTSKPLRTRTLVAPFTCHTHVSEVVAVQTSETAGPPPERKPVGDSTEAGFLQRRSEMRRAMDEARSRDQPCEEVDAFTEWMAVMLKRVPPARATKLMRKISKAVFEAVDRKY